MMEDPGTRFNYNSGATEIVASVVRRATGTDIEEYAAKHLFAPLGITHWFWKRSSSGLIDTEGGLYLEARDLAKLWYLFLNDGKWDGKQVVSSEWVKTSVAPFIPVSSAPNAPSYGLAWWLYPTGKPSAPLYWAGSGFGGQIPVAMTEQDMIVVFNGWNILPGPPVAPRAPHDGPACRCGAVNAEIGPLHRVASGRGSRHSINDQWRICFRFFDADAYEVEVCDYH